MNGRFLWEKRHWTLIAETGTPYQYWVARGIYQALSRQAKVVAFFMRSLTTGHGDGLAGFHRKAPKIKHNTMSLCWKCSRLSFIKSFNYPCHGIFLQSCYEDPKNSRAMTVDERRVALMPLILTHFEVDSKSSISFLEYPGEGWLAKWPTVRRNCRSLLRQDVSHRHVIFVICGASKCRIIGEAEERCQSCTDFELACTYNRLINQREGQLRKQSASTLNSVLEATSFRSS